MTSRFGDPWESPGFLLWHATLSWQRLMVATLKQHGLTHGQFVLLASLWWLTEHGPPPSQRQLGDHAGTDPTMTSQVLRVLEGHGQIVRQPDPLDARARCLSLTDQGRQLVRRALPAVEAADQRFFAPASDLPRFSEGLRKLIGK